MLTVIPICRHLIQKEALALITFLQEAEEVLDHTAILTKTQQLVKIDKNLNLQDYNNTATTSMEELAVELEEESALTLIILIIKKIVKELKEVLDLAVVE